MDELFDLLLRQPEKTGVFNPWQDRDEVNDASPHAPIIRRRHLRQYLAERLKSARIALIAEAVGYQGGHFSGIAMTSERIFLGRMKHIGIHPHHVMTGIAPQRTSRIAVRPNGFTEPTATIVWGHILGRNLNPFDVVLWNAFPWHPYDPQRGFLSNRTPTQDELDMGHRPLEMLMELCDFRCIVAVGKRAQEQLHRLGITAQPVRHPANGGARKFRSQLDAVFDAKHANMV